MVKTEIGPTALEGRSDSKPGKAAEQGGSGEEAPDERKGIFVRLSPKAKKVLEDAAVDPRTGPTTYAKVIETLLEYYGKQDPDLREQILHGSSLNPLRKEVENLLARLHRAEHAVVNKRYYFAVKTYKAIADNPLAHSEELLDVCHYRLGHCWQRLSFSLRVDALSDDFGQEDLRAKYARFYVTALAALEKALFYLRKLRDDADPLMTLIKHYNIACCYSLKAQYIVESRLEPGQIRARLRDARKDIQQTQNVWDSIGETWRGKNGEDGRADAEAKNSLDELKMIYSAPGESDASSEPVKSTELTSERTWCVEMAAEDSDLIFLRSDEKWKGKFNAWKSDALKDENSLGKAIEDLLNE